MLEYNDFIRFTTESWGIEDNLLDDNDLVKRMPLPQARLIGSMADELTRLDALPVELLHLVYDHLDLETIASLLAVNRATRHSVLTMPSFSTVTKHCPLVWKAATAIRVRRYIQLLELHGKLYTTKCEYCNDHGRYIYLLGCKRVCFLCLSNKEDLRPLSPSAVTKSGSYPPRFAKGLRQCITIPGIYSPYRRKLGKSRTLIDPTATRDAIAALNKARGPQPVVLMCRSRKPLPKQPMDGKYGDPLRFATVAKLPSIDPTTRMVHVARFCGACLAETDGFRMRYPFRRQYDKSSYEEHLRACGPVRYDTLMERWFHDAERTD